MSPALRIGLALAVPLLAAVLVWPLRRRPNVREAVTLLAGVVLAATVASLVPPVLAGDRPALVLGEMLEGLPLALRVEPLGLLFALLASLLWPVTSLYSIGYTRGSGMERQTAFYSCFAVALASVVGIAFAANLLTLFVFYEVLTLSTWPLVTHGRTGKHWKGGRRYLGYLVGTSVGLLLPAVIWTWALAGTLEFRPGGILQDAPAGVLAPLLFLFVFGTGKAAVMPMHRWLPSAMVAPAPVSALLHAVAVVKAGVFTILKVAVYVFGLERLGAVDASTWLAWVAAATIVIASLIALTRDDLKERLAYSTVGQLSYIVLGALLATATATRGAALHMVTHAAGKITLFFCAGAIMLGARESKVSRLGGLGRAMPVTFAAFLVGSVSIIGLPPCGGLWSKWMLALGAAQADEVVPLTVLLLSSLLAIGYLLPIPVRAFFGRVPDGIDRTAATEAPLPCLVALVLTSLACVASFLFADRVLALLDGVGGVRG